MPRWEEWTRERLRELLSLSRTASAPLTHASFIASNRLCLVLCCPCSQNWPEEFKRSCKALHALWEEALLASHSHSFFLSFFLSFPLHLSLYNGSSAVAFQLLIIYSLHSVLFWAWFRTQTVILADQWLFFFIQIINVQFQTLPSEWSWLLYAQLH